MIYISTLRLVHAAVLKGPKQLDTRLKTRTGKPNIDKVFLLITYNNNSNTAYCTKQRLKLANIYIYKIT